MTSGRRDTRFGNGLLYSQAGQTTSARDVSGHVIAIDKETENVQKALKWQFGQFVDNCHEVAITKTADPHLSKAVATRTSAQPRVGYICQSVCELSSGDVF